MIDTRINDDIDHNEEIMIVSTSHKKNNASI